MNDIERAFCDADEKILAKVETWIFFNEIDSSRDFRTFLKLYIEIDIECAQFSLSHPHAIDQER